MQKGVTENNPNSLTYPLQFVKNKHGSDPKIICCSRMIENVEFCSYAPLVSEQIIIYFYLTNSPPYYTCEPIDTEICLKSGFSTKFKSLAAFRFSLYTSCASFFFNRCLSNE